MTEAKRTKRQWGRVLVWMSPLLLLLLGWGISYVRGGQIQLTYWTEARLESKARELKLISNFGSVGFSLKTSNALIMSSLPETDWDWQSFAASASQLNDLHPEGFWAWQKFFASSFESDHSMTKQLAVFVPYWLVAIVVGLLWWLVVRRAGGRR